MASVFFGISVCSKLPHHNFTFVLLLIKLHRRIIFHIAKLNFIQFNSCTILSILNLKFKSNRKIQQTIGKERCQSVTQIRINIITDFQRRQHNKKRLIF